MCVHDIFRKKREEHESSIRFLVLGLQVLYYLILIYSILG